jgi:hypothetical protein
LKTLDDALEMRRRVLLAFEAAERESDPVKQRRLLTFVIVGGGPTGVELAGALAEIARNSLPQDFRSIRPNRRGSCCSRAVRRAAGVSGEAPPGLARIARTARRRSANGVPRDGRSTRMASLADGW